MGLDYSFKIYIKKEQIWNALQGVVGMAVPHKIPARIHFPENDLLIPLDKWGGSDVEIYFNDPEFFFATVLNFEEDEPIHDYLRRLGNEDEFRGPPDPVIKKVSIGYIYLSISQKIPEHNASDLVLFDFGTTGTRMSILFSESTSIHKTFHAFAEKFEAVCGLFNREESAEVFWMDGKSVEYEINDPFLLPDDISRFINSKE